MVVRKALRRTGYGGAGKLGTMQVSGYWMLDSGLGQNRYQIGAKSVWSVDGSQEMSGIATSADNLF
jgi:hypothetical protein